MKINILGKRKLEQKSVDKVAVFCNGYSKIITSSNKSTKTTLVIFKDYLGNQCELRFGQWVIKTDIGFIKLTNEQVKILLSK